MKKTNSSGKVVESSAFLSFSKPQKKVRKEEEEEEEEEDEEEEEEEKYKEIEMNKDIEPSFKAGLSGLTYLVSALFASLRTPYQAAQVAPIFSDTESQEAWRPSAFSDSLAFFKEFLNKSFFA